MGFELIIALGALVLALVALTKSQSGSTQLEDALKSQRHEHEQMQAELRSRLEELARQAPATEAPGPDLTGAQSQRKRTLESTVQVLEMRAREHDALLCSLVSEDEARHLWNIARDASVTYDSHPGVQGELRSLVRRGLVKKRGEFKIHELPSGFTVSDHFELSESGEVLLSLRKHLEASDSVAVATSIPPRAAAS
jgi:hypothetical protein